MFCSVVIPHTKLDALTYSVPEAIEGELRVGSAVRVELVKKVVSGIATEILEQTEVPAPKPVLEVVEPEFCSPSLLSLTKWVSHYYISSWGETLTLAFPSGVVGYRPRKAWTEFSQAPSGTAPTLTLDQSRAVHNVLGQAG